MNPETSRPKALVFGRNEGAPYHPLAAVEGELASLLEPDYEVRVSDRGEVLLALGLGGTELLVGYDDRWTEPLDRRHLDAVEAWVRAGGRFTGHGPAKDLTFTQRDGESFVLWEEPYRFSIPWFSGNRVWATYEDGGRRWPACWTRVVGQGRITFTLPGHGVEAFQHPDYRRWLVERAVSRTEYPGG